MPKFFIKKTNIKDSKVIFEGSDIKHITKVLRKNVGDVLEVSDGEGYRYKVKIQQISQLSIAAEILESYNEGVEDIKVTLFQSLPKANKMEFIIQKCTELGIAQIIPFVSNRTVVNIEDKNTKEKKVARWQKIASEACKQCDRTTIPKVDSIQEFEDVLDKLKEFDLVLVAYEKETDGLKKIFEANRDFKNIAIIIGPEGGFEEREIDKLLTKGVSSITLGKRILRTETAGMALLCIVMYELGLME